MPEDFHFVRHSSLGEPAPADLYTPMRIDLAAEDPGSGAFAGLARVREGVPQAQVAAAIDAVAQDLDDLWGNPGLKMWGVGLEDDLVASVRPALLTLLAAATFLLVILGANLATLLLGRAVARDRELAVLSALGAARGQLLQSLLAESVVIAGVGGALGIGLAAVGVDAIRSLAPADLPRRFELAVDPSVVMVALAGAAAMALAAGLLPALRWLRGEVAQRIRETAGRTGGGVVATRTRSALVVLQVALSLMLLVSAGLLTRAYAGLLGADPGFDVRPALTFDVSLDQARYDSGAKVTDFDGRFRDAVAALPGVVDVGGADALPLSAEASQMDVAFPGAPGNTGTKDEDSPLVDYFFVGAGYGEAVGMRLLEGRWLTSADDRDAPPVLLIDDLLASRFFPDGTAAGSRVSFGGTDFAIAGVVDHARHYTVAADDRPQLYLPVARTVPRSLSYVVAVDGDPSPYGEQVRRILDALDPGVPMSDVSTLEDLVRGSLGRERLSLTLLLAFALGALLLATLGIYGVVANGVAQRTHEMGVRMALGAGRGRVVSLVLGQGLRLTLWGTALGVGGSLAASRLLEGVAVGVEPGDPAVYGIVALGLTALTGVAAWIPARRATRIDPVEALRNA